MDDAASSSSHRRDVIGVPLRAKADAKVRLSRARRRAVWIALAVLASFGSCWLGLHRLMSDEVEAYKPAGEVRHATPDSLRGRISDFHLTGVTVGLEWNTYDNEVINRAPYKLFIVAEPTEPGFDRLIVDDVRLTSSTGRRYTFADSITWPVVLRPDSSGGIASRRLEPAFHFDHAGGEQVSMEMRLRVVTSAGVRRATIRTRWLPVVVEHFAPIV